MALRTTTAAARSLDQSGRVLAAALAASTDHPDWSIATCLVMAEEWDRLVRGDPSSPLRPRGIRAWEPPR